MKIINLFRLLNRVLDNYNSVKLLFLNVETVELLEPFNVYEFNKRLQEKSYNIFHFLVEEVKGHPTYHDARFSSLFVHNLQMVSDSIAELY